MVLARGGVGSQKLLRRNRNSGGAEDGDDAAKKRRICMGGCWKVRIGNRDGTCGRSLRSVLRL